MGSVTLARLFNVSSATIRNEMSQLEAEGFIKQPHTSAGRVPTDKGYRYYVNQIGENKPTLAIDRSARAIDTRIVSAGDPDLAIRQAVDSLVELTHNLGIATIGNQLYMSGLSDLFGQPEFLNGANAHEVARLLDNLEPWLQEAAPNEPINVFIGRENPIGKTSGCSLIVSRFQSPFSDHSYIGVLGPTRQSYKTVMELVQHTGKMLGATL